MPSRRSGHSTAIIGAAGEHYVLFQLLRRGLKAARPPEGTPEIDLIVFDERHNVIISLQVKTRLRGSDGGFVMNIKHESLDSERLVYVFVDLQPETPRCYVIPSKVVSRYLRLDHSTWLATPGRGGKAHRQTSMRQLRPFSPFAESEFPRGWMDEYLERWDLLESLTSKV
jgi:Holliday junction resolvase-like predicted endonuclease